MHPPHEILPSNMLRPHGTARAVPYRLPFPARHRWQLARPHHLPRPSPRSVNAKPHRYHCTRGAAKWGTRGPPRNFSMLTRCRRRHPVYHHLPCPRPHPVAPPPPDFSARRLLHTHTPHNLHDRVPGHHASRHHPYNPGRHAAAQHTTHARLASQRVRNAMCVSRPPRGPRRRRPGPVQVDLPHRP